MGKGEAAARARRRAVAGVGGVIPRYAVAPLGTPDATTRWAGVQGVKTLSRQAEQGLPEATKLALFEYRYFGYKNINAFLRKTGAWQGLDADEMQKTIDALDIAIDRQIGGNVTVFRGVKPGVDADILRQLKSGDTFIDHGYTSTSFNRQFATTWSSGRGILFRIAVPKMARGIHSAANNSEYELLLMRGTKFRVLQNKTVSGTTYIDVEVVQ